MASKKTKTIFFILYLILVIGNLWLFIDTLVPTHNLGAISTRDWITLILTPLLVICFGYFVVAYFKQIKKK